MSNQELRYLIKNELQYLIFKNPNSKFNIRKIYKKYKIIIDGEIIFYNNFSKKVYCFLNNIKEKQICLYCKTPTKFRCFSKGFDKYCKIKCCKKHTNENRLNSLLNRVENKFNGNIIHDFHICKIEYKQFPSEKIIYNIYKKEIDEKTSFIKNSKYDEKVYCFLNNIKEVVVCIECGKKCKFQSFSHGYRKFCSQKCDSNNSKRENRPLYSKIKKDKIFYGELAEDLELLKKFKDKTRTYQFFAFFEKYKNLIENYTQYIKTKSYIEQIYCFVYEIKEIPKCLNCNNEVKFIDFNYGYTKHCSSECNNKSNYKYDKMKKTMNKKYNCDYAMQNTQLFLKQQKYSWKKYKLPSGKEINIQGYENFAFDILFEQGYLETDIIYKTKSQPKIWYTFRNKKKKHYLDIYIPKENRIIEIKSEYTFNRETDKILAKQSAAKSQNYIYEIWILSPKGEILEIM